MIGLLLLAFVLWAPQTTPATRAWILSTVQTNAGRVDYNATTGKVAFDRLGGDGYVDVWISNLDGSSTVCLTCDHADLTDPNKHMGQPAWTHDGQWVLFQKQVAGCTDAAAVVGSGGCNDLWAIKADGTNAYQLYTVAAGPDGALLHAQLNAADNKVFFSERTVESPSAWRLVVCDIEFVGTPSTSNCVTAAPGALDSFYESHQCLDATCDTVLFSCTCDAADNSLSDIGIQKYVFSTTTLTALADGSNNTWNEHAHQGSDGRIVWASSFGNANPLLLDYGIMDADGTHKQRITHFNQPGDREYRSAGVIMADLAWVSADRFVGFMMTNPTDQTGPIFLFQVGIPPRSRAIG